ncbi:MAG: Hsp33 family molecular chaperone HslO [Sebaldella sp.]|nr:Hsp33 family molecular chaperone HslO [Sebaldella sp.]
MGKMIRGISKNARFFICDTKDLVQEAMDIHSCSATGISALGRVLTAAGMMGKDLKSEDDSLTIRVNGDGPAGVIITTANKNGEVKGYMGNPQVDLGENHINKLLIGEAIGNGTLYVIKDMGLKEPFSGLVQIQTGEIAEDLAYYFFTSEQIPSVVALGVKVGPDYKIECAGGFILQLLPGADNNFIDKLEEKIKSIRPITELFEGGFDVYRIAKLLYEDMESDTPGELVEEYEILEESELSYKCNCSSEKYLKGLITLGKEEILNILEEDNGQIEVECHFCGKKYIFKEEDFENLEF